MPHLQLHYSQAPIYSLAAQQNAYRLLGNIQLHYPNDDTASLPTLHNLSVRLHGDSEVFEAQHWKIDQIRPGEHLSLPDRSVHLPHQYLLELTDEQRLTLTFEVIQHDDDGNDAARLLAQTETLVVLPANFWGGEQRQPELLAAFVKPNGVYVESLVKQVTDLLEANGHGRHIDGYAANSRERPYLMVSALWNVLRAQRIAYVSPPPSFAHQGQLIRLARDISTQRMGACLDLSVLFASCLEHMGLNPVIALTQGHAFVGVWLIDTRFPLLTSDDPMELRKRVDARDLVVFETTLITSDHAITFRQACDQARSLVDEEHEADFVYVIDITQARARKIVPISTVEERRPETTATDGEALELAPPPPLPPVRAEERRRQPETPQTRLDTWQRRLLDLSKRNALLSIKANASAIRLFCPDIARMEDMLADGTVFSFQAAEQSPIHDRERSTEGFRLQTGDDLHTEYALAQLDKKTLLANMAQKRLESTLVTLYRKARNDLQEGGANTLFLALGMLRWKEDPRDDRAYKAPLILIPVELTRRSARAPVRLRQLGDEDPLFNLTLIEFLHSEYDIDLGHLREQLPEDDSGVDVPMIWNIVRQAISEQRGFEVLEECLIASFSFAKYLMWKDLRDRIEHLKSNPFVAHLVDQPMAPYPQQASFIPQDQIDRQLDPAEIFAPLNCDSSQMVAVEASGRAQDFVLEGPPGTGKSETISNIIAHNLAKGRKVLFVAEKIAALQVVYRRMQKIQLDHLCLEMHSNKANKKAVLDQLRRAVNRNAEHAATDWAQQAQQLRESRDRLNDFVQALHRPSAFGISAREAIARVARYRQQHRLTLSWQGGIEAAPINDQAGLDKLIDTARRAGNAFADIQTLDIAPFRPVVARNWSNAWQAQALALMTTYREQVGHTGEAADGLAEHLGIPVGRPSLEWLERLEAVARLVDLAMAQPVALIFAGNVRERIAQLTQLGKLKEEFDSGLRDIGLGLSAERLANTPLADWKAQVDAAQQSWWQGLFIKRRINRAARALGYAPITDLAILDRLRTLETLRSRIAQLAEAFQIDDIWQGWATEPHHLRVKLVHADRTYKLLMQAVSLTDEPSALLSSLRAQLVEGRDYLAGTRLPVLKNRLQATTAPLRATLGELAEIGVSIPTDHALADAADDFAAIAQQPNRLKAWVEWVAAREAADAMELGAVCDAMEAGVLAPAETENELMTAFCAWLAPRLIDADPLLVAFKAIEHEQLIQHFRQLDQTVADTTSQYIAARAAQTAPNLTSPEHAQAFSVLSRELQKKTRHKPIRVLFEDMGERLLDLCPCMMMSPLSVAQFLPADFRAFDLVVFDEASQITTWDSVGAIARGKNVIVVGDPKQMPPTSFFGANIDAGDPDEEDLESILDQALAARLPHRRLMGHYRSRHETLITFSNHKYYENSLVTYPSSDTKASAVTLRRVQGVYAKGQGRNNPIEARELVEEVIARLTDPQRQQQSLGIVTLNTEQQRTIEDLLDDARRKHPEIEPCFQATDDYDPVFVKNLESVQGDERDVILFSLGYGPTVPGGTTMSMNFGPLNKTGGERRLNVAITRATTEVVVFASFDAKMIDLSRTSATAVEHLKHYLEFAERGPAALAEQNTADHGVDQFDSDFEQAVAWALRDKGWRVQTQVGVSRFRVDLGIRHPDHPGQYLAGVECDGVTYHSSPSARDRDRTRQAVLEHLGWRLVRLWSIDFFNDPEQAIDRIHQSLEALLDEDRRRPRPPGAAAADAGANQPDDPLG